MTSHFLRLFQNAIPEAVKFSKIALNCYARRRSTFMLFCLLVPTSSVFAADPADLFKGLMNEMQKSIEQDGSKSQPASPTSRPKDTAPSALPQSPVVNQASEPPKVSVESASGKASSSSDDDLEKAWACRPYRGSGDGQSRFFFGFYDNPKCPSATESEQRRFDAVLKRVYRVDFRNSRTFSEFDEEFNRRKNVDNEKEKAEIAAKDQAGKMAVQDRKMQLKTGKVKISNISDAMMFHDSAKRLSNITSSPLIEPDGGLYSGSMSLDAQEKQDTLRGKTSYSLYGTRHIYYAYLKLNSKTVKFDPESMRIGADVNVVGKYVANAKYRIASGEEKTAPVLEILFIGKCVPKLTQDVNGC